MNKAQKVAIFLITAITLTLILGVAAHLRPAFIGGWVTSIIAGAVTTLVCYGRGKGEKS
jgi:hypothetical protein